MDVSYVCSESRICEIVAYCVPRGEEQMGSVLQSCVTELPPHRGRSLAPLDVREHAFVVRDGYNSR